ncbi:cation:proton antiporter [Brevundimonas subvibrioides]|uniref:Sodium/hydrogen exchanger n=1 Tax=Brevundimonas subvibrioides (strain ATCC 15264 / DSM 4735 / LMG 14903 / NBRC 16000 / CB 81) TaxID=633149 RepID=D9QNH2_BRESC|nr:cation:proton antiporter [Brevundimonas subvibrioides]ADL02207.1 sodium/hydrogen exchanger [Brevundimonas subvibrioides ATCC 15264]
MHTAMNATELFLIAMLIIFTIPWMVWRIGRTDAWAPLVVVQIVAGVLLGPGLLGAVFPAYYATVFTPSVIGALNGIAWWAVMLFVWVAGVELDLKEAWRHRTDTTTTAGLALIVPMALGAGAALFLTQWPGWIGSGGLRWQVILGMGMACAVTALPILVLFLEKLNILRLPLGQRVLRYASLDDVAIWGVLALILLDWERVGRQALFLVGFVIASLAVRALLRRLEAGDRWYVGLIWLALCGFTADWSGLHFMVGAFLSGAVLEPGSFDRRRLESFRDTILMTIMPVFFLSTGLRTEWGMGGLAVFGAAALLLVAAVVGKLAGVHLAGRILNWPKGEAGVVGWLLQTKALIMIIFANVLLDKAIITHSAFTALLLMAVASTMLTIPVVTRKLAALAAPDGPNAPARGLEERPS